MEQPCERWYRDCTNEQLVEHIRRIGEEIIMARNRVEGLEATKRVAEQALESKEAT